MQQFYFKKGPFNEQVKAYFSIHQNNSWDKTEIPFFLNQIKVKARPKGLK